MGKFGPGKIISPSGDAREHIRKNTSAETNILAFIAHLASARAESAIERRRVYHGA
jgi:hypothetical protein